MGSSLTYQISYGKRAIPVYRVYATPLAGIVPIPESTFTGRGNVLFAAEIDVEVFGDNFLPAYTQGDNSNVVATDSMKNFVLRQALAYDGATLEGMLSFLGHGFLTTYPQMQSLRLTGRELPFDNTPVPQPGDAGFAPSEVLFSRGRGDYATAALDFARGEAGAQILAHRCGRVGLQLLKVTGSAFTRFVRDEFTTLPERGDRPLFIYLDLHWRYGNAMDMLAGDHSRYVPSEQVRDIVATVFHQFVSESIQHLVHEMGTRILERFPQLAEVSFVAQNRTRDPVAGSADDPRGTVYSDPFPAYGEITLTVVRHPSSVVRRP
jgi:urate oxidase